MKKTEWKDVRPQDSNNVFEMVYDKANGHCWPEPLYFKDVRGRHKVTRLLVEIEIDDKSYVELLRETA